VVGVDDGEDVSVVGDEVSADGAAGGTGEHVVESGEEAGDVLDDSVARADRVDAAGELPPQAGPSAREEAGALSSRANILARKSSTHDINSLNVSPIDFRNVSKSSDIRPPPTENR
jgi:hypothetical protein